MKFLNQKMEAIRAEYGPWTAHNLELAPDVFTIAPGPPDRAQQRASLYLKLANIFLRRHIRGMRILDLGCLEGGISLYLAQAGARCTGVDIRAGHLVKAKFAASAMGLGRRCHWIEADVTDVNFWKKIGQFDLVICSGLLYHLDAPDIVPTLIQLRKACRTQGIALIDSNIAPAPITRVELAGQPALWGCYWQEHNSNASPRERMAAGWSSYHNNRAFWLTERSLVNAVVSAGFCSVFKPLYPYHEWGHQTRDVWVALPGRANEGSLPMRTDPDPRPWAHPGMS
jgi:2-polyprenyl-3-methyl-5-hydroxy-6-metoxy-1,4-benzoquinol methylase